MTSGRIGSAVGGRVIPGTASRLLESAMQVNTVFCIQSLIAEKRFYLLFHFSSQYILSSFRIVLPLEEAK